jgi:hypothetical protein
MNTRQRDAIYRPLEAATSLDQDHIVLELDASDDLIVSAGVNAPYAVSTKSTKSKRKQLIGIDEYDVGADVPGQIKVTRSGLVDLALAIDHGALEVGDKLVADPTTADGKVGKATDAWGTNDHLCVAVCEEVVAVPGAGLRTQATVKAYLNFVRYGGM